MDSCCSDKESALLHLRERQSKTLVIVLILNTAMFGVEFTAGLLSGSIALIADSLDMLGDALVYGFSLYVVGRPSVWKTRAALVKAAVMGLFGVFVLGQVIYKIAVPQVPAYETMGVIGTVVLLTNALCLALLWRHRAEDINMRSVWMCSRNDLIANVGVLIAALAVWVLGSGWPDVIVGAIICVLFLRSSLVVTREARAELSVQRNAA